MRRSLWCLLAFLLCCGVEGWGAIALVGSVHGNHVDASGSSIATSAYSQGAGHSLAIGIRSGLVVSSISDTAGDTFTASLNLTGGDGTHLQTYCVANTNSNASNVVTASFATSGSFQAIIVHEYSGTDTASCPDTTASNTTSADPITSGSFTPGAAGNVAVAFAQSSHLSTAFSAGSGYTLQGSESYLGSEDLIGTGTSAQTASIGFGGGVDQSNIIAVIVLKASGGGSTPKTFPVVAKLVQSDSRH